MGAATGEVAVRLRVNGFDMAGSPIADAVRLQTAAAAGTLLIERPDLRCAFGRHKVCVLGGDHVYGKREEKYQAAPCVFDEAARRRRR